MFAACHHSQNVPNRSVLQVGTSGGWHAGQRRVPEPATRIAGPSLLVDSAPRAAQGVCPSQPLVWHMARQHRHKLSMREFNVRRVGVRTADATPGLAQPRANSGSRAAVDVATSSCLAASLVGRDSLPACVGLTLPGQPFLVRCGFRFARVARPLAYAFPPAAGR